MDKPNHVLLSKENPNVAPTGKVRLFVANFNSDMTESEFKDIFKSYGELSEVFVSKKGFGFIKLSSKYMADKACMDLDGLMYKNKTLRVRISTNGAALKVLNLSPHVTNEILYKAFAPFGLIDKAVVIADERGKSTCEGIVEFSKKNSAIVAMKKVNEGVLLLTKSSRPVVVEPIEPKDYDLGVSLKILTKTAEFLKETSVEPMFMPPGTFEYDYGNKWKALYQQEKIQRDLLEKKILEDRSRLESEMEGIYQEYQAQMLRMELAKRQEELRRVEEALLQKKDKPSTLFSSLQRDGNNISSLFGSPFMRPALGDAANPILPNFNPGSNPELLRGGNHNLLSTFFNNMSQKSTTDHSNSSQPSSNLIKLSSSGPLPLSNNRENSPTRDRNGIKQHSERQNEENTPTNQNSATSTHQHHLINSNFLSGPPPSQSYYQAQHIIRPNNKFINNNNGFNLHNQHQHSNNIKQHEPWKNNPNMTVLAGGSSQKHHQQQQRYTTTGQSHTSNNNDRGNMSSNNSNKKRKY